MFHLIRRALVGISRQDVSPSYRVIGARPERTKATSILAVLAAGAALFVITAHTSGQEPAPQELAAQVAKIFQQQCSACHNSKKPEGGLVIEDYKSLMAGGDSGPAVVAGKPDASYLVERVESEDDPMPPNDNPVGARRLNADEIALVKKWIEIGAPPLPEKHARVPLEFRPLPPTFTPIYAIDASADGQYLAFGRGDTIWLTDQEGKRPPVQLVDPALGQRRSSHLDIVQSLAFSPDSQLLASGGYRSLKIWRLDSSPVLLAEGLEPAGDAVAVSGDGNWLAAGAPPHGIEIVDVASRIAHRVLAAHPAAVRAMIWIDGDRRLLSCDAEGNWRIVEREGLQVRAVPMAEPIRADQLIWLGSGVAGRTDDQRVFVMQLTIDDDDVKPAAVEWIEPLQNCRRLFAQAANPTQQSDSASQAAALWGILADGKLRQYDLAGKKVTVEVPAGMPNVSLALVDPSGQHVVLVPEKGHAQVWNIAEKKRVATLDRDYFVEQRVATTTRHVGRQKALIDLLAKRLPQLEAAAKNEQEALKKAQEARDKAAGELEARAKELETAQQAATQVEMQLAQARKDLETAKSTVDQKMKQLVDARAAAQQLAAKKQAAQQAVQQAELALTEAQKQLQAAQQAVEQQQSRLAQQRKALEQAGQTPPEDVKQAVQQAEQALAAAQKSLDAARAMQQQKTQQLQQRRQELAQLTEQVKTAELENQKIEQQLKAAQAAMQDAQRKIDEMSKALEEKRKAVEDATGKKQTAEQELAKREQALATAKDATTRANARIPELQQTIESEKQRLAGLESELADLNTRRTIPPAAPAVTLAGGDLVAVATEDAHVHLFRFDGTPAADLTAPAPVIYLASRSNGLLGLTASGHLVAWRVPLQFKLVAAIGSAENSPWSDRVTALDFSPDGRLLAVGSGPPSQFGEVKLVATDRWEVAQDFGQLHSDTVFDLAFSPDGRMLASAAADKLCRLIDVESGQPTRNLEGHTHHVLCVTWRDDGRIVLTGSADQSIKVWDAESGEQQRTIGGLPDEVTSVVMIGQTPHCVASLADGSVRQYDSNNGSQIRAFGGAQQALFAVALSADQELVFAGGQAGRIWAWQLKDGKLVATIEVPTTGP